MTAPVAKELVGAGALVVALIGPSAVVWVGPSAVALAGLWAGLSVALRRRLAHRP